MEKSLTAACVALFCCTYTLNLQAQTCPMSPYSPNSWEWPGHNNWLTPQNTMVSFTGGVMSTSATHWSVDTYEGTTTASDDNGNLMFYANGVKVWDATNIETYSGLLSGQGGTGKNSACQGIITIRHPLSPDTYYILTTDDAFSNTAGIGLNLFEFDQNGNRTAGPTKLLNRTTEAIAATTHANGVDIWVTVHEAGTNKLVSYLIGCNGVIKTVETTGQAMNIAFVDPSRGGMKFSPDGSRLVEVYGQDGIVVMSFDNATGLFSNAQNVGRPVIGADFRTPYDVEIAPGSERIYISTSAGEIFTYDISSMNAATILSTQNLLFSSPGSNFGALEIGGDGNLYHHPNNLYRVNIGDLDNATGLSYSGNLNGGSGRLGLPTMYIPPAEEPDITEVGPFCNNTALVDLETNWVCNGINAEDPDSVLAVYSGPGIIDAVKGIFDPSIANIGANQIIYERCSVNDTIIITVNVCGGCTAPTNLDVTPQPSELCVGDNQTYTVTFNGTPNDDYYITWFDDDDNDVQGPTTDGISGADEYDLDNAQLTHDGTWTVRIEDGDNDDATCYEEFTFDIGVTAVPVASIAISPNDSICDGETVTLTASDGIGGTSTYGWADLTGTNDGAVRNNLSPSVGNTNYTVTADNGNGCTDDTTITITVIANPIASIAFNPNDTVCDGTDIDVTPSGGTTLTWEDASTDNPRTISTTGNYTLTAANFFCTDDTTFHIEVLPVPSLTAQGGALTICDGDSTGTIALTSTPVGATYTWTSAVTDLTSTLADETTGANSLTNHTPVYAGTGTQGSVTYSIIPTLNGCAGTAEDYVIQVDAQPVATVGVDIQICADNTTLTGNDPSPFTGLWTNVDGDGTGPGPGTITTDTQFNSTLTNLVNGDSTYLNWTVSNGVCGDSTSQLIIKVSSDEIPTVSLTANPTSICSGEPIDLTATGTGTGAAPLFEFFSNGTSIRAAVIDGNTYLGSTDFTNTGNAVDTLYAIVEMVSNTACLAAGASATVRDTVEIIIDPNPSTSVPGADQTLCSDSISMAATLPTSGNGTWEHVSGPGTIDAAEINNINAPLTGLNSSAPTVYAWVVRSDNNLCPVDSQVVTITTTGNLTTPAVASQSTTLCETDTYPTLTGTVLNAAAVPTESGVWTSLDGPAISVSGTIDATITASSMTAGNTYHFLYTTSNGLCPVKTDTVKIDINAAPTVSLTPTTANSCGLTPFGLSATASDYASISWTSDGGGSFSPTDSTVTDFTPPAQNGTTYNLTITAAGVGTCSDATASLALTVNAGPTVNAGIEDTICEGTSLDLSTRSTIASATRHTGLSWSATPNVGSFDDNTAINPVYTPPKTTTSGNITLTLSATGNAPCSLVEDDFVLTIRENPTVPNFSHTTTSICASTTTGVPVDLVDDGSLVQSEYSFSWYQVNTSGDVLLVGPQNGNAAANLTGLSNGDQVYLQADYISSVCPSNATNSTASAVSIDAEPDLSIAASSAAIVCINDAFTLSAADGMTTTIDPAYSPSYSWADASGSPLTSGSLDFSGSESSPGSHSYILSANNGLCSDQITMSIIIKEPYVEAIVDPELIDQGEFADVSAIHTSLEPYTHLWSTNPIGMDGDGSVDQTMSVSPEATTTYTVIASLTNVDDPSSANCSASASVELQVIEPIQIPDAFTPNGDGINDSLTIIGIETYAGAKVEIYNRWGNVVYSTYGGHNYKAAPWDGKLNGKELPAGVYYYTIDLGLSFEESSTSENKQPMSGSVMLMH